LLYSAMAAAMYASVIASASRGGFILTSAEILVVPVLLWLQGRTSGRAVGRSVVGVVLLLAVFTAVVGWGTVWERLRTPDPFAVRREFSISSMRMIADRPWFGFGLGTWPVAYPAYAIVDTGRFANRAHADWLEWTADGGLPLGIAMATLFLWCLRPALGYRSACRLSACNCGLPVLSSRPGCLDRSNDHLACHCAKQASSRGAIEQVLQVSVYGLTDGLDLKVPAAHNPMSVPPTATPATMAIIAPVASPAPAATAPPTGTVHLSPIESTVTTCTVCEAPGAGVAPGIIEPVI